MTDAGVVKKILVDLKPDISLLNQNFDGYKLSLEPTPIYEHKFGTGVSHVEPSSDQYSFQHVRLFGLHNHLYADPWTQNVLYFFNKNGKLVENVWDPEFRRFASSEVWSEPDEETAGQVEYNRSISFECKDWVFILNGRKNATLYVVDTGDRVNRAPIWDQECLKIENIPSGVLTSSCTSKESKKCSVLIQSVVEADKIEELKLASKQPGANFATLLHWINIDRQGSDLNADDCGSFSVTERRDVCVHGPVDFACFEERARAVYVASQKKAFFAEDSTRPVTPLPERVLRKPVRYTWEQSSSEMVLRFSVMWPLEHDKVKVDIEDQMFAVAVTFDRKSRVVISGETLKRLDLDKVNTSVSDGRVEIRIGKQQESEEPWDNFIPGDEFGQPAPDPELVRQANGALQHLTSDKIEDGEVVPGFNCAQLEECDASPADTARLVRLATNTHAPTHRVQMSAHQWICGVRLSPENVPALVLRHDVDAIVWQPETPAQETWRVNHVNTFNAFGYVQASKEQKKFIVCPPDLGFVAICESSQHVYLYHQASPVSGELKNRVTGRRVPSVCRQQVVRTDPELGLVMGAHAANSTLFLLFKNSIVTLLVH